MRAARGFFGRPLLPFLVQLTVLVPLILAAEPRRAAASYLFFLPWLLPVFALLNLPFVFAMFRAFKMDPTTRRNHALEHATILELEARTGRRLAGRAGPKGFRVSGHVTIDDVHEAFDRVRQTLRAGEPLTCVTPRCGSNIVTAIGFGLVLLLTLVAWSVASQPPWAWRAGSLVAVMLSFVALRRPLGSAIQQRFFISTDFGDVTLRNVRHVPAGLFERGSVVFVETIVRTRRVRAQR